LQEFGMARVEAVLDAALALEHDRARRLGVVHGEVRVAEDLLGRREPLAHLVEGIAEQRPEVEVREPPVVAIHHAIPLHLRLLDDDAFARGAYDVHLLSRPGLLAKAGAGA
jgi:hypothetical protein